MSNPVRMTKTLATANADGIAEAQTLAAAGEVDLDGAFVVAATGIAVLDTGRRVIITSAGDDTGVTFTVTGTLNGTTIIEDVTGVSAGVATSLLDFDTVTSVYADGATDGDIEVGTNGVGATPWKNFDWQQHPVPFSLAVGVTGTVNFTVQYTYDEINSMQPYVRNPADPSPIFTTWNDPILAAVTASGETTFDHPVTAWRVLLNSGTGSLTITGIQAGIQG